MVTSASASFHSIPLDSLSELSTEAKNVARGMDSEASLNITEEESTGIRSGCFNRLVVVVSDVYKAVSERIKRVWSAITKLFNSPKYTEARSACFYKLVVKVSDVYRAVSERIKRIWSAITESLSSLKFREAR